MKRRVRTTANAMAEAVDIDGTAHSKIDLPLKQKKENKQEQIRAFLQAVSMFDGQHNG